MVKKKDKAILLVNRQIDANTIKQLSELFNPIVDRVAQLEQRIVELEEIVGSAIEEVPPDGAN